MNLEVRDIWHETRERCKADPFFFGQEILGFDYQNPPQFQKDVVEAMKRDENYILLAPRGHGKTWLCDICGVVWEIIRDPDVRILLCHGVLDRAQTILKSATDHFRKNEKFRTLFPEHAPTGRSEDPTMTRFTTPARSVDKTFIEPTVMAAAPGSTVTGFHFDVIKATDLVNEQNVPAPIGKGTKESMQTVVEFVKTFVPLLDSTNPRARRQFDGTRWYQGDAWGFVLEKYSRFTKVIEGIEVGEDGLPIPIWDLVTQEQLIDAKEEAGKWLWYANYVNAPLAGDTQMFKREWFYEYEELPEGLNRIAVTVDLAITEKESADRTAIVVTGICPQGNLYVLHTAAGHWSSKETLERIFTINQTYSPDYVGIESVAYQKLMLWVVWQEAQRRGITVPLRKLIPDGSKQRRAFSIATHAEYRGIYVKPGMDELVEELVNFPVGKHDDLVDALAYRGLDLYNHTVAPSIEVERLKRVEPYRMTGEDVMQAMELVGNTGFRVLDTDAF